MPLHVSIQHVFQGLAYLGLAPLVLGVLQWAKARLQRRRGPAWLQPYRDLRKLLRKRPVVPENASWVFNAAPLVVFACYALPGFLMPVFYLPQKGASPVGDLLTLVYLLGLARLALGLAGMDAGAPFGGLGSSRELFVHVLAEPTLIFVVYTLAFKWRTSNLPDILWRHRQDTFLDVYTSPPLLLLALALALTTLAETGRLPFDNPSTHLELTMFGKAIHLEYAGPHLALLEWAEALRLTWFFTLLLNLFAPWLLAASGGNPLLNALAILLYPLKLLLLALALALWEALQVKTRLRAIVTPALTALIVALIAAILVVAERYLL
jgi:formate hydrogenlyase subunit 4